ncbi:hypothetical protein [Kordia zhangzhouensis]|uniref:hypothetical protein n=1 Tax=Kordia zhangzhouensis TaxID=1620405 RepID=UPI0006291D14|nr:hypothetical protein [Kordia zhangzhouensis]
MKKQNLQQKLSLHVTRISQLSNLNLIYGGQDAVRFTKNSCVISDVETCQTEPIKITEAIRCTHTLGNGLDINGNPCTY